MWGGEEEEEEAARDPRALPDGQSPALRHPSGKHPALILPTSPRRSRIEWCTSFCLGFHCSVISLHRENRKMCKKHWL